MSLVAPHWQANAVVLSRAARHQRGRPAGAAHRALGVVADQQAGGAILWTATLPAFCIVAVALLTRWLSEEETEALTAGLNRLLKPPMSAWPPRSGLR